MSHLENYRERASEKDDRYRSLLIIQGPSHALPAMIDGGSLRVDLIANNHHHQGAFSLAITVQHN